MLFVDGNPNLVDAVRFLVNDPSSAANNLYSAQEVKDAINLAYFDVYSEVLSVDDSWFYETSFADSVTDQEFYQYPADMNYMVELVVEYDGKNIDTDTSASPTRMQRVALPILEKAERAAEADVHYWSPFKSHFKIYPATSNSGTKSIGIQFVVEPTALSADDDEPLVPTPHHKLIAVKAAIYLMIPRRLDVAGLKVQEAMLTQNMYKTILRDVGDTDQFQTSAFVDYTPTSGQGFSA